MRRFLPVFLVGFVWAVSGFADEIRIDPRLMPKDRRTQQFEEKVRGDKEVMALVTALKLEEATKLYLSKLEKPTADELLALLTVDGWLDAQLPEPPPALKKTARDQEIADKVSTLGDDDFETRVKAQDWLEKNLPKSLSAVFEAKDHKDPEIAYRAKLILKALGEEKNAFLEIENEYQVRVIVPANLVKAGTRLKKDAEGEIAPLAGSAMRVWAGLHEKPLKPEHLIRDTATYKALISIVFWNDADITAFWRERLDREERLRPEAGAERGDAKDFGARHLLAVEWLRNFPPGAKVKIVRTFEDGSPSKIEGVGKYSTEFMFIAGHPDGHRYSVDDLMILLSASDTPFVADVMTKSLMNRSELYVRESNRPRAEVRSMLAKFKRVNDKRDESDFDRRLNPSK